MKTISSAWSSRHPSSPSGLHIITFGLALLTLTLCPALGQDVRDAVEERRATSASGRFLVFGEHPDELAVAARWADDVAHRVERSVGLRMTFDRQRRFLIRLADTEVGEGALVRGSQAVVDGVLHQRLLLRGLEHVDWEQALEEHCALLLGGYVVALRDAEEPVRRRREVTVPAWLSSGIAQHIDPALRARNRRLLLTWRKAGRIETLAEIMKWRTLPRKRCREKAVSSVVLDWLLSLPQSSKVGERIFSRLADDEPITVDWLGADVLAGDDAASGETAWRAWLDRQDRTVVLSGRGLLSLLGELRNELQFAPGENAIPPDASIEKSASPRDLLAAKKEVWIPDFCDDMRQRLSRLKAGSSAEFAGVADAYASFFEDLGKRRSDRVLRRRLATADAGLAAFQVRAEARQDYMNAAESRHVQGAGPRAAPSARHDALERSEFQRYIDQVEAQTARTNSPEAVDAADGEDQ